MPRGDTWHPLWSILTNKILLVSLKYYIFAIIKILHYEHIVKDIDWSVAARRAGCGGRFWGLSRCCDLS